jgi:Type I phosphodiesterase / nucleotide pyrophosphatase
MGKKLVILHVDGLGADALQRALERGDMPFVRNLTQREGYEVLRYRCGLPSTTPFAQAGILYGDNREIPSFRWWDRERKVVVQFGAGSTFKKVADKYFAGTHPLTRGGACIAACYPGEAADDFGIAYQDRGYDEQPRSRSAAGVLVPYLVNPAHLADWVWQAITVFGRTARDVAVARSSGRHPARPYVATDVAGEIFVHHLTRYAVLRAMREGYSPIYAGFYAFDETAHAFGPADPSTKSVLKHVDRTIQKIARARGDVYELVVLSDHGQIETTPFRAAHGEPFGQVLAGLLPGFRVQEAKGKAYGPAEKDATGRAIATLSGGAAHLYLLDEAKRLPYAVVKDRHPALLQGLARLPQVAMLMLRDGEEDVFLSSQGEVRGDAVRAWLAPYDEPEILQSQLSRLNSFRSSGDVVVFGAFLDGKQVNFENQAGGHGSIGGEQLHPFVLAKREWSLDLSGVTGAHLLHPVLSGLRDRLA